ncbi:diguanylate cyclase [Luteimonas yindakuii]|uniref:diguanylate cyclase n=1 Tax=Luteimonas yindakuii TaxID=2565782 RepID=A0A4Z1RB49_9GAMM|nr:ligand-binding sensor domain-containing diguanylate cyclase [Luteimonas yindakuii]TKS53393.1 diguanylate cyclase [Luteimonas yindakuii]
MPGTRDNGLFNLFGAFEDREGNLWLGSLSNGLTRLWDGWTRRYSTTEGLPDATVWALQPDPAGDGIWVGTNNGMARLHADGRFRLAATDNPDATRAVRTLFVEPGRVWMGLRDGLVMHEPGHGTTTPPWAEGIHAAVMGIVRDRDGSLWVSTREDLLRWTGETLEHVDASRGLVGPVAEFQITPRGRRLALTPHTLLEFDGHGFVPAPEARGLPEGVRLHGATELADGRLLLAGEGSVLLFQAAGRWHRLDTDSGLPRGTAFHVIEHAGFLWVSSMHGVYRLPIADLAAWGQGRIARVGAQMLVNERGMPNGGQQGLCCNGAGRSDGFISGDTVWLPTRDGVLALDTTAITRNPVTPAVHVRQLQAGGQPRAPGADGITTLAAHERDLTLAFDVLSFQDPRSNGAHYRLVGYDQDWQVAGPMQRDVRYTNLPPGDYTFEVTGSNNADAWSPAPARLEFVIRPHFHETLGFRLLLLALALLLVYAGYRYQRYRYRIRQARLSTLVAERTAALAESNRQLEQASLTDPLTGLRNRRYLARQVPADLDYYGRHVEAPMAGRVVVFALLDLDLFKQVNDRHGHAAGDRVLVETARRLQALVRGGDYVVRWGGEEFLLVFRPMGPEQVLQLGGRLCHAVSDAAFDIGDGHAIALTASVGLSAYPAFRDAGGEPLGWEAMVELADQALYHVKRNGRNGAAMLHPTATTRSGTLLADLQHGVDALLRRGELTVTHIGCGERGDAV